MSNKIDLSLVADVIKRHKVAPPEVRAIIEELNQMLAKEDADKPERAPKTKKQHVILSTDGHMGWVVQLPEGDAPQSAPDRINVAAHAFNASKKGSKLPVKSLGEAIEFVPARFFKDSEIKILTKLTVPIFKVANVLVEAPSV